MSSEVDRLAALMARADALPSLELEAKLQWLEDAAEAAEALKLEDAALHLRATLGAFVQWAEGPEPQSELALAELEVLTAALLQKGLAGTYRGLAEAYSQLGTAASAEVQQAFLEAAAAVERGESVPGSVGQRLERALTHL